MRIWMIIMMLAKFIAEPCSKINQGALINILIVCITIFDQEWIQSLLKSFKATRYLLSDAMVALHWTSGFNHPAYRSISIDIFISIKQRGLATSSPSRTSSSVPVKPAGDGGEAHRDTLLSRVRIRARGHLDENALRARYVLQQRPPELSSRLSFRKSYSVCAYRGYKFVYLLCTRGWFLFLLN